MCSDGFLWLCSSEAVARTLKPLWRTKKDFEIQDMGNHILLFVFANEADANRVLLGEPWSFDKYLVVLRRYEDDSVNTNFFNCRKSDN